MCCRILCAPVSISNKRSRICHFLGMPPIVTALRPFYRDNISRPVLINTTAEGPPEVTVTDSYIVTLARHLEFFSSMAEGQKPNIFAEREAQSGQAGQAGQPGEPGQPGQPGEAENPGKAVETEGPARREGRWENAPDPLPPYMPEWTHPEWSPDFEYNLSGRKRRRVYIQTGQILRPAILPMDADKNPTDFARYAV